MIRIKEYKNSKVTTAYKKDGKFHEDITLVDRGYPVYPLVYSKAIAIDRPIQWNDTSSAGLSLHLTWSTCVRLFIKDTYYLWPVEDTLEQIISSHSRAIEQVPIGFLENINHVINSEKTTIWGDFSDALDRKLLWEDPSQTPRQIHNEAMAIYLSKMSNEELNSNYR